MLNAWAVLWITESCPQTRRKIADVWGWCYLISITWSPIAVKSAVSCLLERVTKKGSVDEVVHKKQPFLNTVPQPVAVKKGNFGWHRQKAATATVSKDVSKSLNQFTCPREMHMHFLLFYQMYFTFTKQSKSWPRSCSWISVFHVPIGSYSNVMFWGSNYLLVQPLFSISLSRVLVTSEKENWILFLFPVLFLCFTANYSV